MFFYSSKQRPSRETEFWGQLICQLFKKQTNMVHLLHVYTAGPCSLLPRQQQQADLPHLYLQMRLTLHTKAAWNLGEGLISQNSEHSFLLLFIQRYKWKAWIAYNSRPGRCLKRPLLRSVPKPRTLFIVSPLLIIFLFLSGLRGSKKY